MKSENIKTSYPHKSFFSLSDKRNLPRGEKSIVLSNLSISYTWKNIKRQHRNKRWVKIK